MATLNFKGKVFVQNHHLLVKHHQLAPRREKSLTDKVSLHDNLKALKALLPIYAGKVKCIYIDPPYNTGNEKWVYNDNVNSPMMQDWLGKVVDKEDLTRHDKWLCMMMPRLKLLCELLSTDGSIFISIDDNEVHHLRNLMDQVFGEENFLATIVWQKVYSPANDKKGIDAMHDYIVAYSRSQQVNLNLLPRTEKQNKAYLNPDNDPRGPWKAVDSTRAEHRDYAFYPISTPSGKEVWPSPGRSWVFTKEELPGLIKENRLWFGKDGSSKPSKKLFLTEVQQGLVPTSWWAHDEVGHNDEAKKEVKSIVEADVPFGTPKPTRLLKRVLQIGTDKDSIVLDSFAGSGTTAQAVLQLNEMDGGDRRFILVECEDYANKITAERVKHVIKGVPKAKDDNLKKGLGGSFSYFELGPPIEMESILSGDNFPSYADLARYVFYTATGEEFDESALDEKKHFIGESRNYLVYLFYQPDMEYLKATALTLDRATALGPYQDKRRLVFAPTKYIDQEHLDELRIDFAQLPFEIYQLVK